MDFKNIELIVFDLDYTLLDSADGIVYCFNEARKSVGEPVVEAEEIKKNIGLPIENTFKVFGSKDPEKMRELFRKTARKGAMAERSFLLPGVFETIPELKKRGHRMAVASTKSRTEIERILEHLGIKNNFEAFVGSDEVKNAKPAPDPLLLMIERTGVPAHKMVYVGDHVVDIRSARAAGTGIIAVLGEGPCPKEDVEAEGPDIILEKIIEILKHF
jgi:HAD superfamily hydrolase (TIGR01549 family)